MNNNIGADTTPFEESTPSVDPAATRQAPEAMIPTGPSRYQILREHAKGGLGEVFVAYDRELDREVALKQIQGFQADNLQSRWRFLMEAKITGGLEHPGIVPVYGLGAYEDGRPYYAMRFVRGDTLEDAIVRFHDADQPVTDHAERALAFRRLLGRFVDVCNAVEYAHSRGVIHRDLKPGNVMLGDYGETIVVDWGLAKSIDEPEERIIQKFDSPPVLKVATGGGLAPTQMGIALGTPQFMSPEQALGRIDLLGPTSDVYSLGATLYCLLTGCVPFHDDSDRLMAKIERSDFRSPRQVSKKVPPALNAICLHAMQNRPSDRYHSARELADDIERWLADDPVSAYVEPSWRRAARWMRRHRALTQAACGTMVVATVASLIATGLIERQRQVAEEHRVLAETLAVEKNRLAVSEHQLLERSRWYATELGLQEGLADCQQDFIPRGVLSLARSLPTGAEWGADSYGLERSLRWQIAGWGATLHKLETFFIGQGPAVACALTPDGRAFVLVTPQGTTTQTIDSPEPPGNWPEELEVLAINPPGRVAIVEEREAHRLSLRDTVSMNVIGAPITGAHSIRAVAFSGDGLEVAAAGLFESDSGAAAEVRVLSTLEGASLGGVRLSATPTVIALSFDGATLAMAGDPDARVVQLWNVAGGRLIGGPLKHDSPVTQILWSSDGKSLATGDERRTRLWRTEAEGAVEKRRFEGRAAAFSPDGATLLTIHGAAATLYDVKSGQTQGPELTHDADILVAAFSGDSRLIATGGRDRTSRIWNAKTHERVGARASHESPVSALSFSDSGDWLVTGTTGGEARAWRIANPTPRRLDVASPVRALAMDPQAAEVVANNQRWEVAADQAMGAVGDLKSTSVVAASAGGKWLILADGAQAQVWNALTGAKVGEPLKFEGQILAAAVSADGETVVLGGQATAGGAARVYSMATGEPVGDVVTRMGKVQVVAISAEADRFLVANGRVAEILSCAERHETITPPLEHGDTVMAGAFSADGQLVATGTEENKAQIWNAKTGERKGAPLEHGEDILAVAFSDDGALLLTGAADRIAQLWEVASGKPVGPALMHPAAVRSVGFGDNGRALLTGCDDGVARLWKAPLLSNLSADELVRQTRATTGIRIDKRGTVQPLTPSDWAEYREQLEAIQRSSDD